MKLQDIKKPQGMCLIMFMAFSTQRMLKWELELGISILGSREGLE